MVINKLFHVFYGQQMNELLIKNTLQRSALILLYWGYDFVIFTHKQ